MDMVWSMQRKPGAVPKACSTMQQCCVTYLRSYLGSVVPMETQRPFLGGRILSERWWTGPARYRGGVSGRIEIGLTMMLTDRLDPVQTRATAIRMVSERFPLEVESRGVLQRVGGGEEFEVGLMRVDLMTGVSLAKRLESSGGSAAR